MHPVFKSTKTILYLILAWLPITLAIISLQYQLLGQYWKEVALLLGPPLILELFFLLSTWYVSRSMPLQPRGVLNLLIRHSIAAFIYVVVWLQLIMLYSELLALFNENTLWRDLFNQSFPMLTVLGFLLYFLATLFNYLILTLEKTREAEQKVLSSQLSMSQAELNSLKATIHPHFLFNSLTALSTLTLTSPEKAQQVCLQLADFLRYSLKYSKNDSATIKDEIEHIENYLGIEKTRLGNRLNIELNIAPETKNEQVMPLIFLPLIENAIKHGIEQRILGGTLDILLQRSEKSMLVTVKNPIEKGALARPGEGMGLSILERRLNSYYGNNAKLTSFKSEENFIVNIQLPLEN